MTDQNGDQPDIVEPSVAPGALVYAAPDIGAHCGRVQRIEDGKAVVDFHDWIAAIPVASIHFLFLEHCAILVARSPGRILQSFGLCEPY